jgi:flavin-dependent dehydrogenase
MVGDAFGFVDPMLSPGVFLALRSAELVARALAPFARAPGVPPAELVSALRAYAQVQTAMVTAWMDLVAYLYDGRMLALLRAGQGWLGAGRSSGLKGALRHHIERHVALQASGTRTTSRYSRGLLRWLGRHGLRGVEPAEQAIQ